MESPNLWITCIVLFASRKMNEKSSAIVIPNAILIGCFLLHYINRSIVYPLRMSLCNDMPVSVTMLAFTFCCWNGFNQATSLLIISTYPIDWISNTQFITGIIIFFFGLFVNVTSDGYLLSLKREKEKNGTSGYVIPRGGLFDHISCPNYCKIEINILNFSSIVIFCGK